MSLAVPVGIFMIFEMTLSYPIMLPLMLACVLAYFVVRATGGVSMYEISARRGRHEQALARLRSTQMAALIQPAQTVLPFCVFLFAGRIRFWSFSSSTWSFSQYEVHGSHRGLRDARVRQLPRN